MQPGMDGMSVHSVPMTVVLSASLRMGTWGSAVPVGHTERPWEHRDSCDRAARAEDAGGEGCCQPGNGVWDCQEACRACQPRGCAPARADLQARLARPRVQQGQDLHAAPGQAPGSFYSQQRASKPAPCQQSQPHEPADRMRISGREPAHEGMERGSWLSQAATGPGSERASKSQCATILSTPSGSSRSSGSARYRLQFCIPWAWTQHRPAAAAPDCTCMGCSGTSVGRGGGGGGGGVGAAVGSWQQLGCCWSCLQRGWAAVAPLLLPAASVSSALGRRWRGSAPWWCCWRDAWGPSRPCQCRHTQEAARKLPGWPHSSSAPEEVFWQAQPQREAGHDVVHDSRVVVHQVQDRLPAAQGPSVRGRQTWEGRCAWGMSMGPSRLSPAASYVHSRTRSAALPQDPGCVGPGQPWGAAAALQGHSSLPDASLGSCKSRRGALVARAVLVGHPVLGHAGVIEAAQEALRHDGRLVAHLGPAQGVRLRGCCSVRPQAFRARPAGCSLRWCRLCWRRRTSDWMGPVVLSCVFFLTSGGSSVILCVAAEHARALPEVLQRL